MKTIISLSVSLATLGILLVLAPAGASEVDDRIEAAVKDSYVFRNYLKEDGVRVQSREGVVTLTGTVPDETHRSMAQETVRNVAGVKHVENRLRVEKESSRDSDWWLKTKVKSTLLFHRNVDAGRTQVSVEDGVAILTGSADSQAQKDLTGEYVRDVEGIRSVDNELTVVPDLSGKDRSFGDKMDDASITAQVKMALLYHRSTSALRTEVETRDGVVTLRGSARNGAERDLADKIARDIKGVRNVRNDIVVQ